MPDSHADRSWLIRPHTIIKARPRNYTQPHYNYNHHFLHQKGFHDLYDGDEEVFMDGEYFPDLMVNRAVDFIEQHKDQPFFLYAAFNIPHYSEQADRKFDSRYAHLDMPRQSYAKMVSTTDDRMGVVLDKLDETGLRNNTIVIFMSDNGHSCESNSIGVDDHTSGLPRGHDYGAHGGGGNTGKWRGCKGQFFEGGIRVPAVISYPKELPVAVVRDQTITACDWLPTVLDLCDVPLPDVALDGKSLRRILEAEEEPSHHRELHWQWAEHWAVLEGTWKLIGNNDDAEFLGSLEGDHPEQENFIESRPDTARRLHQLHEEWRRNV
jgi:arylsulfatase A